MGWIELSSGHGDNPAEEQHELANWRMRGYQQRRQPSHGGGRHTKPTNPVSGPHLIPL